MEKYVVIAAAGYGKRFGSDIPKQFVSLNNVPVIVHAIRAFLNSYVDIIPVIVVSGNYYEYVSKLLNNYFKNIDFIIVKGKNTRTESIKKGLDIIPEKSLVAIHDAVRPVVSSDLIYKGFLFADKYGSAIPVIDIKESLREITGSGNCAVSRGAFKIVQTPQFFRSDLIKSAYSKINGSFSDDATVLEYSDITPFLFEGETANIKITTKEDLIIAKALITKDVKQG